MEIPLYYQDELEAMTKRQVVRLYLKLQNHLQDLSMDYVSEGPLGESSYRGESREESRGGFQKDSRESFQVGDHVSWNSEAGRVSGTILKIHTANFIYKGYTHHASLSKPQYEIQSDKTSHIAAHYGQALTRIP